MTQVLYKVSTRVFLALAVLIALGPFLDQRVLRMAGDEKVYVTTAVEMARDGRWFVQTLADEPSYFKGPMHYLFLRVGMAVFGDRLIAGTWMNCLLALLAGLAMHRLGRRRWDDKSGLLLGVATALNVGLFSHALASQMEVEVLAFYAFATASLGLAKRPAHFKYDLLFWLSAGLAGWSKSPLHSALIGTGGLLYWALTRQLVARLTSPAAWAALAIGVFAGIAGYLPAYFLDKENFVRTFLMREQFEKANNNRSWDYVMKPLLHFALPWTVVILAGLLKSFKTRKSLQASIDVPMAKLGLSMALPTLLFWCTWTYKGQNYNLPALPALLLFGWACFKGHPPRIAYKIAGALGALTLVAAGIIVFHFWPLPDWWHRGWLVLGFLSVAAFTAIFLLAEDIRAICVGAVAFFLAFGAFIAPIGEREMVDMRKYLRENPGVTYHYYNLDPSIWNEWALLQLTLHHPIYGLHRAEQLGEVFQPSHAVIVQNKDNLNFILNEYKRRAKPGAPAPVVTSWNRWLTKGKTPEGASRWKIAWKSNDLRQLEREFYIVRFQ